MQIYTRTLTHTHTHAVIMMSFQYEWNPFVIPSTHPEILLPILLESSLYLHFPSSPLHSVSICIVLRILSNLSYFFLPHTVYFIPYTGQPTSSPTSQPTSRPSGRPSSRPSQSPTNMVYQKIDVNLFQVQNMNKVN